MKTNYKTLSLLLRVILSSVTIILVSYLIITGSGLTWLSHIVPVGIIISILITAFLIKTDSISQSIWSGVFVGLPMGVLFFSYNFVVYYLDESMENLSGNTPEVVLGFITIFSIFFTIIWILSCIAGATISYFIRKRI
ncbi:MAG: hypothetical protein KAU84_03135, partial [Thermoplasmatales archaeon]|nr:hypothetical protein [Thermoplasmatales archaeon]